jgi:hypothetical protein
MIIVPNTTLKTMTGFLSNGESVMPSAKPAVPKKRIDMNLPTYFPPISIEWLKSQGACKGQIENVLRTFQGKSEVEVTLDNLRIAVSAGLNLNWLARQFSIEPFDYAAYNQDAATHLWKEIALVQETSGATKTERE